jgi:hypothetical protein
MIALRRRLRGVSFRPLPLPDDPCQPYCPDQVDQHDERCQRRFAFGPAHGPFWRADRSCLGRFAAQKASEFIRELLRRGIATRWLLFEALQADGLQIARQSGHEHPGRNSFRVQHRVQRGWDCSRHERRTTGKEVEKKRSQRINISGSSNLAGAGRRLLGCHIAGRTEHVPAQRQTVSASNRRASPKSVTCGASNSSTSTFDGLRSRCRILCSCAK